MSDFEYLVPTEVAQLLDSAERDYLLDIFDRFSGYPNLRQLWKLMDEPWLELGCDSDNLDQRVTAYYNHPVWLLNGLFIEQDPESLSHRRAFTRWAVGQHAHRVADFGGGFGSLARQLGIAMPDACVEVVEPHPHPAAIALAAKMPNVRYVPELTGSYDLLIATDVFEHVGDPLGLAASTAEHLRIGGTYFMANCFEPLIACHLRQHLHFSIGWDECMRSSGLQPMEKVKYGRAFKYNGKFDVQAAHRAEELASRLYSWVKPLPKGRARLGRALMRLLSAISAQ